MKMMMGKRLSAIFLGAVLLFLMVSCQTAPRATVGEPPVPMKTVTQDSTEGYVTFEFQVPESWAFGSKSYFSATAVSEEAPQKKLETEEALPFMVNLVNYYYSGNQLSSEEDRRMYKDLFSGKTRTYEEKVNHLLALSSDFGTPTTAKDYLDLLLRAADSRASSDAANTPQREFQYQQYNGTNGKITEVQYSCSYQGKTTHLINCYREDIPYVVSGAFDDSLDLSSGEIALWVADSLKVTEHFTISKDGVKKKE